MTEPALDCPACLRRDWRPRFNAQDYLTGERFDIVACQVCGTGATWPQPRDLSRYYGEEYYGGEAMDRFPAPLEAIERKLRALRARKLLTVVERLSSPAQNPRVLDVGCGRGVMLTSLLSLGWECHGTELSEESAAHARSRGIQVHIGSLTEETYAAGSFDVITSWHSLEHMVDPRAVIRHAAGWLRPGGVLLVAVPDFGSLQARFGGPLWFHLDPPRHLFHFNRAALGRMLREEGLLPTQWGFFSPEFDPYGWLQTIENRIGFPLGLLYRFLHLKGTLSPDERRVARAALVSALPLGVLAVALSLAGALLQNGSSMEVWATKPA